MNRRAVLLRQLLDHAVPAEPAIGLVAWGDVESDDAAGWIRVASARSPFGLEPEVARQDAAVVRGRDDPPLGVDQHHPGARGFFRREAHALHDRPRLRLPVEMHRKDADRLAVRVAAFAYGGDIGRDLRTLEQRAGIDVGDRVLVARRQGAAARIPWLVADLGADDLVAIGPAIGDDVPGEIAQPQIEIDRVRGEDDAQALAGVFDRRRRRRRRAVHYGRIGRPPADIAGALIEVAVGDLDGVERKVDQAVRARLRRHLLGRLLERIDPPSEAPLQLARDIGDLPRYRADLAGDDRKAAAVLAGTAG